MNTVLAIFCRLAALGAPPVAADPEAFDTYAPRPLEIASTAHAPTRLAQTPPPPLRPSSEAQVQLVQFEVVEQPATALAEVTIATDVINGDTPVAKPTVQAPSPAEVREIMRIRRMTSPLRGTLLDDDEFARHLKFEFSEQADAEKNPSQERGSAVSADGPTGEFVSAEVWRQRTLRSLERRLKAIARELDELDRSEEANQARQLSETLNASR